VFIFYLKSCGLWLVFFVVVTYLLSDGINVLAQAILSKWKETSKISSLDDGDELNGNGIYFVGFIVLSFLSMFFGIPRGLLLIKAALAAAVEVNKNIVERIFRAPMKYFSVTPTGRLAGRISKDLQSLDKVCCFSTQNYCFFFFFFFFIFFFLQSLPDQLIIFIAYIFTLLITFTGCCISMPVILIGVIPCVMLIVYIQNFFIMPSIKLRRYMQVFFLLEIITCLDFLLI
jgi:ABC-type multidrug transport system fused ATPase/permease subunit